VRQMMVDERLRNRQYTRDYGQDSPEIRNWSWPH
jgi:xylulose-5-phosphate/fructose-6-phosphate phosphoketolase